MIEVDGPFDIARIEIVDEYTDRIWFQYRDGTKGTAQGPGLGQYRVGDGVAVNVPNNIINPAPDELWPDFNVVGVVVSKKEDFTLLRSNSVLKLLPADGQCDFEEGNTVVANKFDGVVRVLSKLPVKSIDIFSGQDIDPEDYRVKESQTPPTFEDFGGLSRAVERARELIEVQFERKENLKTIGVRPVRGILFTGEPGTGKTLLARIIAAQSNATFYKLSGPEIISKWLGDTEKVLRVIFEAAGKEENQPSIIFIDEIDGLAGSRANDVHEATKKVVAQLLTLMDGFDENRSVIVIAATNRPDDIDPALRRPGRFDWEIEFPLPDIEDRIEILEVSTKSLTIQTDAKLNHQKIAKLTDGWSAAELTLIWTEAGLIAAKENRMSIRNSDYIVGFERVREQKMSKEETRSEK